MFTAMVIHEGKGKSNVAHEKGRGSCVGEVGGGACVCVGEGEGGVVCGCMCVYMYVYIYVCM